MRHPVSRLVYWGRQPALGDTVFRKFLDEKLETVDSNEAHGCPQDDSGRATSPFYDSANLRYARACGFHNRVIFDQIEYPLRHLFVNIRSSSNFDGIADEQLEPGIPELKTWLGTRGFNLDVDAAFNARMLAFDFEAILRINGVYGRNELLFGGAVIGVRGNSQDNFMPGILRARNLLEEWSASLEQHQVGKNNDAAGGIKIQPCSCQFHDVEANQTDVDDVAGDARNADAISDPNAVSAHDEKICCDREEDRL